MKNQRVRLEDDSKAIRAVIDSMGEGLIAIDAEGRITAVNPYTLKALRASEDELLGKWFSGVVVAVDQHRQPLGHLDRPIIRALTSGEAISDYAYYLRLDGTLMPVFVTVSPIIMNGRPSGAIELFRDITSDQQLDLAKEEFVSLASHQLRTPASGVKAILSMLLDEDFGELSQVQRDYLLRAVDGNDRQIQIIEDILHAARIDSGKMELELEQIDLARLVSQAAADHAPELRERGQALSLNLATSRLVWGDASKLRMVFDNLISNASKYTPPGGSISVALTGSGDEACVSVTDNGVGIREDDMPRLFNKFTRLDNELSTLVGGTGLGLYVADSIIKLHRGNITVTSSPGHGSTFSACLPTKLG